MTIVRTLAEKDPAYRPYCLRCKGLIRMARVDWMLWRCTCGAEHDERTEAEVERDRRRALNYY
jgi:hypothetical protein